MPTVSAQGSGGSGGSGASALAVLPVTEEHSNTRNKPNAKSEKGQTRMLASCWQRSCKKGNPQANATVQMASECTAISSICSLAPALLSRRGQSFNPKLANMVFNWTCEDEMPLDSVLVLEFFAYDGKQRAVLLIPLSGVARTNNRSARTAFPSKSKTDA
jgi:hypothetical protein